MMGQLPEMTFIWNVLNFKIIYSESCSYIEEIPNQNIKIYKWEKLKYSSNIKAYSRITVR